MCVYTCIIALECTSAGQTLERWEGVGPSLWNHYLIFVVLRKKVTSFTPFVSAVCEPDAHENQDGGQHCLRLLKKL